MRYAFEILKHDENFGEEARLLKDKRINIQMITL